MTGKFTIVAYNSVGIIYEMQTTIKDIKEVNGNVIVIHKPKGKRTAYKHTYNKDSELKIYNGWINTGINERLEMVSYQDQFITNQQPAYQF